MAKIVVQKSEISIIQISDEDYNEDYISLYYERLLSTQKEGKESVKNEIQKTEPKTDPEHSAEPHSGLEPEVRGSPPDYILKDPYILEFLDLNENKKYHEDEFNRRLLPSY